MANINLQLIREDIMNAQKIINNKRVDEIFEKLNKMFPDAPPIEDWLNHSYLLNDNFEYLYSKGEDGLYPENISNPSEVLPEEVEWLKNNIQKVINDNKDKRNDKDNCMYADLISLFIQNEYKQLKQKCIVCTNKKNGIFYAKSDIFDDGKYVETRWIKLKYDSSKLYDMIYHIIRFFPEYCSKRLKLTYTESGCTNPEYLINLRKQLDIFIVNSKRETIVKKVIKNLIRMFHSDKYSKLASNHRADDTDEEMSCSD
tara:strand:- start:363 stop:1133 length:771 start_codon:yes stop_codon:yes gene_type:complete